MKTMPPTIDEPAKSETKISGRSIAPGLGMGRAWVVGDLLKSSGPPSPIGEDQVDTELHHLTRTFEDALAELDQRAKRIEAEFDSALAGIFRAHGEMLRELFTSGEFERELRASLVSAEWVVRQVLRRWYKKFEAMENQAVRQRADDVLDLGRNLIRRLRGEQESGIKAIPEKSVLVVERLLPSDVVSLPKSKVVAVVVEKLGQGSHAALLAREKGIPTITQFPGLLSQVATGAELLVDGFRGTLIVGPTDSTRAEFVERSEKWRATLVRCKAECHEPAITLDGQRIHVEANIGVNGDVEVALENGADGVGLLRIEQLYFARPTPPSEDELYSELQHLVSPMGDRPVTIRLLDIGGDKPLPYMALPAGPNPVLGRRGVRLLFDYSQLVRTQLGAILKLSRDHAIRVLIPMVTLEDDMRRMHEIFADICEQSKIVSPPPLGAMVETPAAALAIPALAKHSDFFSVGSNDLTQYTMAAARDDASVNDYFLDGHESVMRLLSMVMADACDRPVTLCGELASRETFVPRLLNMGFRGLSVAPSAIPATKSLIRTLYSSGGGSKSSGMNG